MNKPVEESVPTVAPVKRGQTGDLFPQVYTRLRELARGCLRRSPAPQTLYPTALVHEVFLHLAERTDWKDRAHLLGVAALAMREILVDHVRQRMAAKRGGKWQRVTLSIPFLDDSQPVDVLAIHEAIERLAALNPRQAQVVVMRFFGGMTIKEAAFVLEVSEATVEADWRFARAWLSARLRESGSA